MTLPFAIPDNSKRKFTCFCCGLSFCVKEEFSKHVIEAHEEGREYIICPVPWCKQPVRSLPSHFKTIHAGLPIPKSGQMQVVVWKDFSQKDKKRKPKFRNGYFESKKMNKNLHYRSGLECKFYECLEADPEVNCFDVEKIEIPYNFKGPHTYIPDLIIKYINNKTTIVEIKPSKQTSLEVNKAKWAAADAWCKARGWEFEVITERGVEKIMRKLKTNL